MIDNETLPEKDKSALRVRDFVDSYQSALLMHVSLGIKGQFKSMAEYYYDIIDGVDDVNKNQTNFPPFFRDFIFQDVGILKSRYNVDRSTGARIGSPDSDSSVKMSKRASEIELLQSNLARLGLISNTTMETLPVEDLSDYTYTQGARMNAAVFHWDSSNSTPTSDGGRLLQRKIDDYTFSLHINPKGEPNGKITDPSGNKFRITDREISPLLVGLDKRSDI